MTNTEAPESQKYDTSFINSTSPRDPPKLKVDFSWKTFKAKISSHEDPSQPVYIADFRTFKHPSIVFSSLSSSPGDPDVATKIIGSGTVHNFSINADYELHGQKGKLKALKRWATAYTHLSHTFSSREDGSPAPMTWTSESGFTKWDFICLDENQMPVARFSSNVWAVKKVGDIEFIGDKATSVAARDEIVVIGLTLFSCMLVRMNNIFAFFAAIFAKPGPLESEKKEVEGA